MGIAKSLVYYLVYRPTKSANVTRIMADINRPDFRVASYPPPATFAFVGTCVSRICVMGVIHFTYFVVLVLLRSPLLSDRYG